MNDVSKSNSDLNNLRNKLNKDIKDISATSLSNNVAKESKSAISVEDVVVTLNPSEDIKVTNKEGNPGSIVVMIVGEKGNKIEDEITVGVGTTVTFSNLPWNSGTYVVMAKASVSGSHEFHVTSESK